MKVKLMILSALASLLALSPVMVVAEDADASEVAVGLDLPVLSSYVWRGQTLNDEAVVQPSMTISKGGLTFNYWQNLNLTDNVTGDEFEFSEHDISLSYSTTCPLTGADVTFGVVNYDFPNQSLVSADGNTALVADTAEAFLIAGLGSCPATPTLSVYYDLKEADGFYGSLGVSHSIEVDETISVGLSAAIGAADEDWSTFYYGDDASGFTDWSVGLTAPIAVSEDWTITPGVSYVGLLEDAKDIVDETGIYFGDTDQVVGSLKASYVF